ncbi:MAG: hypothetical protein FJ000_08195 [Actinobacteria bacterium]|nr:hypothetical protein [Actinomycetota bacterium]
MTDQQKGLLAAVIVGGVCGIAGAALYAAWRARDERAAQRVSGVVKQLERVADRMHAALVQGVDDVPEPAPSSVAVRGIPIRIPDGSTHS